MYKGFNSVFLMGRLRDEPKYIAIESGGRMAVFNLDVDYEWLDTATNRSETRTETHPITVFNPHTVDYLEKYIKPGAYLAVEGVLQGKAYKASDGEERFLSRVVISKRDGKLRYMARPAGEARAETASSTPTSTTGNLASTSFDGIPF